METSERLKEIIAKSVLKHSYWGFLFSNIRRKPDDSLPSIMGVAPEKDGLVTLYYNSSLVDNTDDENLNNVITHEGYHLLNKHISRLLRILSNEIDPKRKLAKQLIWNIAADCCVNQQADLPKQITIDGELCKLCFPDLYKLPDNKATEFYYYRLLKDNDNNIQKQSTLIDDHSKWTENVEGISDLSSLSRKIDGYVSNIIRESVKSFGTKRGTLPSSIAELIDQCLSPPKAPYYQIIRKLVRASRFSKFKRAHSKVNRKRGYVFSLSDELNIPVISPFPGRTRDFSFDITLLLDTSGSMSRDDILEGLSGIKNIIENDKHCKVTVLENDAKLQKEYEVKKLRDIQFNISGRGGTILQPGLERAKELNSDVCLCFTDGYCDNINNLSRKLIPKKIIWVIQKDGTVEYINQTGYIVRI
jgi:predicted metal-dependent peptidase